MELISIPPRTGPISSILETETTQTIFDLSTSGWSATRISQHLKRLGHKILVRDIMDYQASIPPALILEPGLIDSKMRTLDVYIDAFNEMGKVLLHMQARVQMLLDVELKNPVGIKITTRAMKEYYAMLQDYLRMEAEVGLVPLQSAAVGAEERVERAQTLAALLQQQKMQVNVYSGDADKISVEPLELTDGTHPE